MSDEGSKQPEPGAGDITILLDGKEQVLRPTLHACMEISKFAGGAQNAIRRCLAMEFEIICEIIAIGTGFTSMKERRLIEEAVYQTGTIGLAAECILFIRTINNGGRIPVDDDGDEGGAGDPDAPLSQPENSIAA